MTKEPNCNVTFFVVFSANENYSGSIAAVFFQLLLLQELCGMVQQLSNRII
jgi:hypothetical protein